jgi:CHAT domain-containing protein
VAASLNNLGAVYYQTGRYAEVEQLYQQALAVQRVALGETHPNIAASLNNLAELYKSMGNYEQAEPLLQQALDMQSSLLGEEHFVVALILNNLAALYVATGRESEALSLMEKAGAMSNRMIGQIFSMGSESQRMAFLATLQVETASLLSFVLQHLPHSQAAVQAALDLVLRRKAIGAEALAVQRDAILGGRYPPLAPMLRELTTLRQQIARWTLTGAPPQGREEHLGLLEEQTSKKEQLEAQLAHQIPEMDLMQKLQSADRQAVARALPDKAALVEFVRTDVFDFLATPARGETQWKDSHYLAFVLVAGKPDEVLLLDLGKADLIDQKIVSFRMSITGENVPLVSPAMMTQAIQLPHSGETAWADERHLRPGSVRQDEAAHIREGRALRKMVFDSLLTVLQGRRRLLLAPDGDLTRLPFEVLPTDDGEYLLDEYQISYLSTGRDVLRFEATVAGQSVLPLVVADPDFDFSRKSHPSSALGESRGKQADRLDRGTLHFRRLPGTRIEGEQIAALLDVQPLLREKALEARLKEYRSPHILHIATHGFFLPDQGRGPTKDTLELEIIGKAIGRLDRFLEQHVENPLLRSGLALAGANTWNRGGVLPPEAEDGLLTAEDVSGLDLLSTELVVLSACETGLGEVHIGEGVFGLRRAFVLAGARTLVMSLWKVPDQQTQELMVDFYQRILAGQPRAEALRQAQIALKAKYPHPRYWGGFICQGDPGPLLAQWPRAR